MCVTSLSDASAALHVNNDQLICLQVSLPIAEVNGCPVGFSLIGPKGSDERLLQLTETLMPVLKR